ncbi:acyltransferase [Neobacillus notoginsengisoli]|uniref:Acyltransferase n=1 Tax=Neobacillus notoginsengisoli TaxID=1578198 RepID=A0A417YSM2_9BACI|nr:acyltransferase [Neobacillus notoginsengisoli]RHW38991.1 acyltransferase [Neobacillus notoginsengisoli]
MSTDRRHLSEIHILRAIGCLFVLLVHVSAAFYYEHGEKYNEITLFINQISRFGTPMFALISGFLLFYQVRFKGFDLKRFISSRFTKIGLPFLFWSIFYLLFSYLILGVNPLASGKKIFLVNFAFGNFFYHLYFMSIVFQFYLLFPLLQRVRSKKIWPVLLALSVLVNLYFLKLYTPGQYEGIWRVILSQRAFLPSWIFFFIFGGFLANYWEIIFSFSKKHRNILGIAVLLITAAAVWEYKTVGSIPSNRATNMINIPIITLFVIGIGDLIGKLKWLSRFFTQIGSLSMAIYLVHPFVLYCFQTTAPSYIWKASLFPVIFTFVLLGTILVVKIIQLLPFNQYILTVPKVKPAKNNVSLKPASVQANSYLSQ